MKRFSSPERLALAGTFVIMVLQAWPAAHGVLEYRADVVWDEPWRLLTAHLVHINWTHAAVNGAAWLVVARLFAPDLNALDQAVVLVAGALAVAIGLAQLYPVIEWYRGFSGALHALFFAGASAWLARAACPVQRHRWRTWLPLAVLVAGWIKVAFEQPGSDAVRYVQWLGANVVPQAHLLGAIAGTVYGVWRVRRVPVPQ
ncbi:MAG TPA: rhombosortase [Burkholderiaceae bacterium]|nr:rhombosortase [Burkholderiaceae bacterium]